MTLTELVAAIGVSTVIAVMLLSQLGTQVFFMQDTSKRIKESSFGHQGIDVLSAWVGRANRITLASNTTDTSGNNQGSVLLMELPNAVKAWTWIDSNGLWLRTSDGKDTILASMLRPPADGLVFKRNLPTSPWEDSAPFRGQGNVVYPNPFSGCGIVVVNYLLKDSSRVYSRALVNLGI